MGMAKQQVYFNKDSGPGIWQALRELKDNPIAHYGLLQARRRAARAPKWRKWLTVVLVLLISAGLSPFAAIFLKGQMLGPGYFSPTPATQPFLIVLHVVLTLGIALSIWLTLAVFHAVRDAALVLATPRIGATTTVDDLVSISALGNNEVLAGVLRQLIAPIIPLLWAGSCLPAVTIGSILILNKLMLFTFPRYNSGHIESVTLNYLSSNIYSARSLLSLILTSIVSFASLFGHGLIAATILILLIITASRKAGCPLTATIGGFLYSLFQLVYLVVIGQLPIVIFFLNYTYYNRQVESAMLFGILSFGLISGTVLLFAVLRLLRNSHLLRRCVLVLPPLFVFALMAWIAWQIIFDSSWLGILAISLTCTAAGPGILAFATGLVDQAASPVLVMLPLLPDVGEFALVFNPGWVLKLISQAALLGVLFIMARDAVRLYRQPGTI